MLVEQCVGCAERGPLPFPWDSSLMECGKGLSAKLFLLLLAAGHSGSRSEHRV